MKTFARLVWTEAKLFLREPVGLIFVFAFPIITMLVIGGSFDANDPAFGGAKPSDYYVAAYIGVVIGALGFVMLPVHLASYRERGVLRRFRTSQFPAWALPAAWAVIAFLLSTIAIAALVICGQLVYGLPTPDDLGVTIIATLLSIVAFVSIGIALGLLMPSARSAQGVGLLLFFPSFLLGGAGPPPEVMPAFMRNLSNALPLTHAIRAIQKPWLSINGSNTIDLLVITALIVAATGAWLHLATRPPDHTSRRRFSPSRKPGISQRAAT